MSKKPIRYISMPNGDVLSFAGPQFRTCTTSATAQVKSISSLTNIDDYYALPDGYTINVRMNNEQLYNGTPLLQVPIGNEVQSLPIYTANGVPAGYKAWGAGVILTLMYGVSQSDSGGGDVSVELVWFIVGSSRIESISLNGTKTYPDNNKDISLTETDPTVPSWAKQATKPSYTALEIKAQANPYIFSNVDLNESDNGIDTLQYTSLRFEDGTGTDSTNGNNVAALTVQALPDGSTTIGMYAVNLRNNINHAAGIKVTHNKDGSVVYNVTDSESFRSAIGTTIATLAETKSYLGIS